MKLLLDTHIWIWSVVHPEKLGRRLRRRMARPDSELYLSPVSIWEAHQIHKRGRLRTRASFPEWIEQALAQTPVLEAPFHFVVAAEASRIELPQNDVGDVFLAATAVVLDLTLATADVQLLECRWLKTIPND